MTLKELEAIERTVENSFPHAQFSRSVVADLCAEVRRLQAENLLLKSRVNWLEGWQKGALEQQERVRETAAELAAEQGSA